MASGVAGKWVLTLLVYFFFLITIVTYASNFSSDVSYSGGGIPTETSSYCDTPRYLYDGDLNLIKNNFPNSKECEVTLGTYSQTACEYIEGCQWDNITTGFLWWTTETETCTGDINTSYYNNGTTTSNVCEMTYSDNVSNGFCNLLGCTPYIEEGNTENNKDGVFTTVYNMATFNADIGLPSAYNYLFTFLFFYLPLLCLILAGLMYIPTT